MGNLVHSTVFNAVPQPVSMSSIPTVLEILEKLWNLKITIRYGKKQILERSQLCAHDIFFFSCGKCLMSSLSVGYLISLEGITTHKHVFVYKMRQQKPQTFRLA